MFHLEFIFANLSVAIQIIAALVIAFISSFVIKKYFSKIIKTYIIKNHPEKETAFRLIQRIIILIIFLIAVFFSLSRIYPGINTLLTSFIVAAGFLSLVIGLAAQRTLANIFAGINIAITNPIRIGDAVVIRGEYGNVEDITLRHTVIKTWDNRRMVIPNSVLDEEVMINYSIKDPKMLFGITLNIPYDVDIEKVGYIMSQEAREHPNVLKDELDPIFSVIDFEKDSIKVRLLFMAKDQPTAYTTATELRRSIKKRFDEEGIKFAVSGIYLVEGRKS